MIDDRLDPIDAWPDFDGEPVKRRCCVIEFFERLFQ